MRKLLTPQEQMLLQQNAVIVMTQKRLDAKLVLVARRVIITANGMNWMKMVIL